MMRVHKILAAAGVASRRGAERMMAAGRVAVNGRVVAEPGAQADPTHDVITVDGRPLPSPSRHVYLMLNKPPGVVATARDPQGRPTALSLVQRPERLFTVGRLDRNTEGLLLLTNDGAWANRVMHPSAGVEKEYEAIVDGVPGPEELRRLAEGVRLPDGHVAHGTARLLEKLDGGARVSLTLHEGHKRQARLMFGAIGHPVRRLVRIRVGGVRLGTLAPGAWRELTPAEARAVTRPPSVGRRKTEDGRRELVGLLPPPDVRLPPPKGKPPGRNRRLNMPTNGADQSANQATGDRRQATGERRPAGKAASRLVIAIDGPAASGKSTIGRALAHALGLLYLDTGAMYRAVTWLALQRGVNPADEAAVTALAAGATFVFPQLHHARNVNPPILVDDHDATAGIREPSVDAWVSVVASYPGVRAALVREQRTIARAQGVVMVGRDISTVVLPDADLKIFLVASAEERARRRYEERLALGQEADYAEIRRAMERRDQLDTERAHSPLRAAPDAVALDTTGLTIDQVIDRAVQLARAAAARATSS